MLFANGDPLCPSSGMHPPPYEGPKLRDVKTHERQKRALDLRQCVGEEATQTCSWNTRKPLCILVVCLGKAQPMEEDCGRVHPVPVSWNMRGLRIGESSKSSLDVVVVFAEVRMGQHLADLLLHNGPFCLWKVFQTSRRVIRLLARAAHCSTCCGSHLK